MLLLGLGSILLSATHRALPDPVVAGPLTTSAQVDEGETSDESDVVSQVPS